MSKSIKTYLEMRLEAIALERGMTVDEMLHDFFLDLAELFEECDAADPDATEAE